MGEIRLICNSRWEELLAMPIDIENLTRGRTHENTYKEICDQSSYDTQLLVLEIVRSPVARLDTHLGENTKRAVGAACRGAVK